MANQHWNVCIPPARFSSSVPIATVCWDEWCSNSNREPTSILIVKFLSHYLTFYLPPPRLQKESKLQISSFLELIKILLKVSKDSCRKLELQFASLTPPLAGGHCCSPEKEICHSIVQWMTSGSLQLLQVPPRSSAAPSPSSRCTQLLIVSSSPTISTPLLLGKNASTQQIFTVSWQLFAST